MLLICISEQLNRENSGSEKPLMHSNLIVSRTTDTQETSSRRHWLGEVLPGYDTPFLLNTFQIFTVQQ